MATTPTSTDLISKTPGGAGTGRQIGSQLLCGSFTQIELHSYKHIFFYL